MIGCVPVQVPLSTVSVLFSLAVPVIVGAAVFFGACPVAATIPVGREVAVPEPELFVAVTMTRSLWPTSAVVSVYCLLVAPAIGAQVPPAVSQRSQAYAYDCGESVHVP